MKNLISRLESAKTTLSIMSSTQALQGTFAIEDAIQVLKNINNQNTSKLDLDSLEKRLSEALDKETPDSLNKWLSDIKSRELETIGSRVSEVVSKEDVKEQADKLIKDFTPEIGGNKYLADIIALDSAIISVEKTIQLLETIERKLITDSVCNIIDDQIRLLNELKSKL